MREYAKVAPTFWTGKTGKDIKRRGIEGVVMATYLMSSPHSNMLGLFYQPILYAAHESGLGIEGASKGLRICIDAGFCSFDEASEMVWVHEMAAYQIADALSPGDKRCKGVQKDYDALPECPFLGAFFDRYAQAFHLKHCRAHCAESTAANEAPSKPHRSQEQEQEQEQEQDQEQENPPASRVPPAAAAPATPSPRGSRLSADWVLPKAWGDWALAELPGWSPETVRIEAAKFGDYWHAKTGKDATKADWAATWRNWCRNAKPPAPLGVAQRPDRIDRQLLTAGLMTGAIRPSEPTTTITTLETFDVAPRVIAA